MKGKHGNNAQSIGKIGENIFESSTRLNRKSYGANKYLDEEHIKA